MGLLFSNHFFVNIGHKHSKQNTRPVNDLLIYSSSPLTPHLEPSEERDVAPWVVRSILYGGPIELILVPASAPRLV